MPMVFKAGTFAANTSTGNQAVTGVGFQPKFLRLIMATPVTADGSGGAKTTSSVCVGMTDGTNSRCVTAGGDDNVSTTNVGCGLSTDLLRGFSDGTPTVDSQASIVSFDNDGFTINWSDAPGGAYLVQYEAWAGSDITNVTVGTFAPANGTGAKSLTGLGFQPDMMFTLCAGVTSTTAASGATPGFGMASGSGQVYGYAMEAQDGVTTTPDARYQHKGSVFLATVSGAAALDASFTSFDSGGFTVNFATRSNNNYIMYYAAIKGGHWKVGSQTTPTSNTTKQTSGLGFQPVGVLTEGVFHAAGTSITAGNWVAAWGAGTNTAGHAIGFNPTNAINQRVSAQDSATAHYAKGTIPDTVATISAWDSDSFTLSYTGTNTTTANEFGYCAFGSSTTQTNTTLTAQPVTSGKIVRQVNKTVVA